jgi:Plasmid pRiA4b ORF-3-like protein
VVLGQELLAETGALYPPCVAVKGACPPDDCGGAWGYKDLRALAGPAADGHDEMPASLGRDSTGEFDPVAFHVDAVNESLAAFTAVR